MSVPYPNSRSLRVLSSTIIVGLTEVHLRSSFTDDMTVASSALVIWPPSFHRCVCNGSSQPLNYQAFFCVLLSHRQPYSVFDPNMVPLALLTDPQFSRQHVSCSRARSLLHHFRRLDRRPGFQAPTPSAYIGGDTAIPHSLFTHHSDARLRCRSGCSDEVCLTFCNSCFALMPR